MSININTNGSNPRWLQRLYDAGLDTIRASTISGHPETYTAYYRPLGYTFEDVKESLKRARDAGVYSSINLLCFPGMIDREREVEALLAFIQETGLRLIQLRNLNIDPEVLLPRMPDLDSMGKALGMRAMIEIIRREIPEVEIGNFTRPVKRFPLRIAPMSSSRLTLRCQLYPRLYLRQSWLVGLHFHVHACGQH